MIGGGCWLYYWQILAIKWSSHCLSYYIQHASGAEQDTSKASSSRQTDRKEVTNSKGSNGIDLRADLRH